MAFAELISGERVDFPDEAYDKAEKAYLDPSVEKLVLNGRAIKKTVIAQLVSEDLIDFRPSPGGDDTIEKLKDMSEE